MNAKIYQEQLRPTSKPQIDCASKWRALAATVALALTAGAAVVAQERDSAFLVQLVAPSQVVVVSYDGNRHPARFSGELHAPFDETTFEGYRPQFYIRSTDVTGNGVELEGTELLIMKESDVLALTAPYVLIGFKGVLLQQGRPFIDEAVDVEGYALAVPVGDTSAADEFGRYQVEFHFDSGSDRATNRKPLPWTWTADCLLRLRPTGSRGTAR